MELVRCVDVPCNYHADKEGVALEGENMPILGPVTGI